MRAHSARHSIAAFRQRMTHLRLRYDLQMIIYPFVRNEGRDLWMSLFSNYLDNPVIT